MTETQDIGRGRCRWVPSCAIYALLLLLASGAQRVLLRLDGKLVDSRAITLLR